MTKTDQERPSEAEETIRENDEHLQASHESTQQGEGQEDPQAWKEKYIRLYADFENAKKRLEREQINNRLLANKKLILALLPTLDNLERAIEDLKKNQAKEETQKGFSLILTNLYNTLEEKGLKAIDAEIGQEPNPPRTSNPQPNADQNRKTQRENHRSSHQRLFPPPCRPTAYPSNHR